MNNFAARLLGFFLAILPHPCFAEPDRDQAIVYPVGVRHLEYVDFQRHERQMVSDVYIHIDD